MLYGAQYYRPPFPGRDCWKRDLEHMKELGFTCVKHWAVWNWIEKNPGVYDFEELDQLVKLSKEAGLSVVINTIPEGAPYWTYDGQDEALYHTADGRKVEYGGPANIPSGGWPGLCMDYETFAWQTADFIRATARHYKEEEAVIAIDVWNEPHLEPMFDYRGDLLCCCDASKNEFRKWLKERYKGLDALNKAWYRSYTSWDQVMPPPRFGTWADMLDWRKFWLENLRRWLKIRVEAAREGAPGKKIQTHVAYSGILGNKLEGGLANELGDEFLLAKEVDWFGLSSFPKWLMGDGHPYRHFIHNEMIAEAAHGAMFYQVEIQGGAGKPGLLGGQVPTAGDVRIWNWNTVAAGGKGSVYWQYAPEPAGIESPGFGLTGFKGEDTPRSRAAGNMAEILNQPWLDGAKRVLSINGIYVSRDTDVLCFASERREEMYAGSLSGVYKAAYEQGIPVRFFHQDYLEELPDSGLQFLYLPMPLILSEREVEVLVRFVEQGGTLVSEACPGLYRPDGLLEQGSRALKRLFGLEHKDIEGTRQWGRTEAWWENQEAAGNCVFGGRFYRQTVLADNDVTVLARFEDGEPAVTRRRLRKGTAVWIGTYPSYEYEKGDGSDSGTGELLTRWMMKGGYPAIERIWISGVEKGRVSFAPVVRLLATENQYVLVAVNHMRQNAAVKVKMVGKPEIELNLMPEDGVYQRFGK